MRWNNKESEIETLKKWVIWNKRRLDEVFYCGVPELVKHHEELITKFEKRIKELEQMRPFDTEIRR